MTEAAALFVDFESCRLVNSNFVIHHLEFGPSSPILLLSVVISEMRVRVSIRNDLLANPAEVLATLTTGHLVAATDLLGGRFAIRARPVLH